MTLTYDAVLKWKSVYFLQLVLLIQAQETWSDLNMKYDKAGNILSFTYCHLLSSLKYVMTFLLRLLLLATSRLVPTGDIKKQSKIGPKYIFHF